MSPNLKNSVVATKLEKVSFHPIPKKGNAKECSDSCTVSTFHMIVRLCSKTFKLGFSRKWTENFQIYKLVLVRTEEPEIKLPIFIGSWRKQGNSRKASTSASLTQKPWVGLLFSRSVLFASLRSCGLQHARLPCPSLSPGACSNSCPLSRWCHLTISPSVVPFSSSLQSFPASGSLQMSQFFASGGRSRSFSFSISPSKEHPGLIFFRMDWLDLLAV